MSEVLAELLGGVGGADRAEGGAHRSVEVEQDVLGLSEDVCQAHRWLGSLATVDHTLSNHMRDCWTNWESMASGSDSALWWNRMVSLPMRSQIGVGSPPSGTLCSCTG